MKSSVILMTLLLCVSACADIPAYSPMRDWVEKQCATNTIPKIDRIFIGINDEQTIVNGSVSNGYAAILQFHTGVTLREIVNQTPLKDTTNVIYILVMRPSRANTNNPSHFDSGDFPMIYRPFKPSDKPEFEVKPLDLIWIYDHLPII